MIGLKRVTEIQLLARHPSAANRTNAHRSTSTSPVWRWPRSTADIPHIYETNPFSHAPSPIEARPGGDIHPVRDPACLTGAVPREIVPGSGGVEAVHQPTTRPTRLPFIRLSDSVVQPAEARYSDHSHPRCYGFTVIRTISLTTSSPAASKPRAWKLCSPSSNGQ